MLVPTGLRDLARSRGSLIQETPLRATGTRLERSPARPLATRRSKRSIGFPKLLFRVILARLLECRPEVAASGRVSAPASEHSQMALERPMGNRMERIRRGSGAFVSGQTAAAEPTSVPECFPSGPCRFPGSAALSRGRVHRGSLERRESRRPRRNGPCETRRGRQSSLPGELQPLRIPASDEREAQAFASCRSTNGRIPPCL